MSDEKPKPFAEVVEVEDGYEVYLDGRQFMPHSPRWPSPSLPNEIAAAYNAAVEAREAKLRGVLTLLADDDIRKAWGLEAEAGVVRLAMVLGVERFPPGATIADQMNLLAHAAERAMKHWGAAAERDAALRRAEKAEAERDAARDIADRALAAGDLLVAQVAALRDERDAARTEGLATLARLDNAYAERDGARRDREELRAEAEAERLNDVIASDTGTYDVLRQRIEKAEAERDEARSLLADSESIRDHERDALNAARAQLREWETVLAPWWDATKPEPSAPEQVKAALLSARAEASARAGEVGVLRSALEKLYDSHQELHSNPVLTELFEEPAWAALASTQASAECWEQAVRAAVLERMLPILGCDAAGERRWRKILGLLPAEPPAPETRRLHEWRDGKCALCGAGPGAPSLTHCGYTGATSPATAEKEKKR